MKRIRCKKCGDVIQSLSRHDFRECKCGSVFMDGGGDYTRYGWPGGDPEDYVEFLDENPLDNLYEISDRLGLYEEDTP